MGAWVRRCALIRRFAPPSPASGVSGRCLRAIGSRVRERPNAMRSGRGRTEGHHGPQAPARRIPLSFAAQRRIR
ncbi:hypothetical protein LG3211_3807 [Lysobacter gummosus]|nr:hypothetical protein LG3211_3807 [Lysobacter gummosus]